MTFSEKSFVLYFASTFPMLPHCKSIIRCPTLRSVATVGQRLDDLVGRAADHRAALDEVLPARRRARLLPCLQAGGAADLALHAGVLRRFGDRAGRHRPARIDAQAAAVETCGRRAG